MCEVPVRCAKFIVRKQWFIAGYIFLSQFNPKPELASQMCHNLTQTLTQTFRNLTQTCHNLTQTLTQRTDDMHLRVYNYNTMEKVKEWEAHTDYIRFVEIHPNRPFVISSSDDMSIKLWDWEKDWECVQVFEVNYFWITYVISMS